MAQSEREVLLQGVLSQLDLSGKLDYKRLAKDIGIESSEAARVRWSRFKAKLRDSTGTSPTKPVGVHKPKNPKSPKKNGKLAKKEPVDEDAKADDELDELEDIPETLPRRMPARKATVMMFKNELSDFEDLEEQERCDQVLKLIEGVEEEGSSTSGKSS